MTQNEINESVEKEFLEILTITPPHTALVYLVKKYGPTEFPGEMNVGLSYLGMINQNVAWENIHIFSKLVEVAFSDLPNAYLWFSENNIWKAVIDYRDHANHLQQMVNAVLYPQPANSDLIKLV